MRYFKRPATQGPSEKAKANPVESVSASLAGVPADTIGSFIRDMMERHGSNITNVKVMQKNEDGTIEDISSQFVPQHEDNDNGLPDGGMRPVAWAGWAKHVGSLERDGWAPARFPVRSSVGRGVFVNGLVRAPFGIWLSQFPVCDDNADEQAIMQLATMTHLHSGLAIGIFLSIDDAVTAAEAAVAVVPEHIWRANDPNETGDATFMELLNRTISAWSFRGIRVSSTRHAHAPDHYSTRLNIFECIDPSTDKPETPLS